MTAEEIIGRLRKAINRIYDRYEGHPLVEQNDIMGEFEDIINEHIQEKEYYG